MNELDSLLKKAMRAANKKKHNMIVQARLESEAKIRVEKRQRFEELHAAFDAERFRFLISTLEQFKGLDISEARKSIDDAMERSLIREMKEYRKAHSNG